MKILKLSPYYYPEQISSTHLTADLDRALEKAGIQTEVYAPIPCRGITEEQFNKYKKIRYEEFSNRLCSDLGLINAYSHITVTESREARHLGGGGTNLAHLSFDEEFFKDKYVLLFDDVITRGDSMRIFARKMQRLGARVVGGLSLGKTKHERPIPRNIPINPFAEEDDDLPF